MNAYKYLIPIFQNYKCSVTPEPDNDMYILRNRKGQMLRVDFYTLSYIAEHIHVIIDTVFTDWSENESI